MRTFVILPFVESPETWEDTPGQYRADGMFIQESSEGGGGLSGYTDAQLRAELERRAARKRIQPWPPPPE